VVDDLWVIICPASSSRETDQNMIIITNYMNRKIIHLLSNSRFWTCYFKWHVAPLSGWEHITELGEICNTNTICCLFNFVVIKDNDILYRSGLQQLCEDHVMMMMMNE